MEISEESDIEEDDEMLDVSDMDVDTNVGDLDDLEMLQQTAMDGRTQY